MKNERGYGKCPHCGGEDQDRTSRQNAPPEIDTGERQVALYVECENCGRAYAEIYKYSHVEEIYVQNF